MSSQFARLYRELQQKTPSGKVYETTYEREREDVHARLGHTTGRAFTKQIRGPKHHGKLARYRRDANQLNIQKSGAAQKDLAKKKALMSASVESTRMSTITKQMEELMIAGKPIPDKLIKQLAVVSPLTQRHKKCIEDMLINEDNDDGHLPSSDFFQSERPRSGTSIEAVDKQFATKAPASSDGNEGYDGTGAVARTQSLSAINTPDRGTGASSGYHQPRHRNREQQNSNNPYGFGSVISRNGRTMVHNRDHEKYVPRTRDQNSYSLQYTEYKWTPEEREYLNALYLDMPTPANKNNRQMWELYLEALANRFCCIYPTRNKQEVVEKAREMILWRKMKEGGEPAYWDDQRGSIQAIREYRSSIPS